ncbi:acyl-CoA N-acyltransferase [Gilbertella persicaria]|uniref:acyl-CoA N-acyltransferase n=1 Tax=Gilbertella persicaria TaxID=101096 RepID=UPI00221F2EAC|nr:acyl-CoA N-acyltransferase [Gilbertella persicaria]KAI8075389.1 acyl-CoA N-acyltransferase [Gilbertella persicaria]
MVQPTVSVRKVIPADIKHAEEATKVVNAAYRSEGGWTTESHIISGLRCTLEDMERFIRTSGQPNTLLFAFEEEQVVGTLQIQPSKEDPAEAEVGLFSVSPLHQSRGIGGKLIRQALIEMNALGFKYAMMHVLENRPEILTWYRKLGFVETGERIPFIWPEMLKEDKSVHFLTLKKSVCTPN